MAAILGSGEHRYRVVENWAKLPEKWELKDVAAVAAYLGVAPSTVRSYLSRRQMPPADYTLSGAPVWRAATIRNWHQQRPSQRPQ